MSRIFDSTCSAGPMLIRCPTCASGYDLAPELLSRERILRCAHCRDAWVHRAPVPSRPSGPEIVAEARFSRSRDGEPSPVAPPRRPAPRGRFRWSIGAAAMAVVALVGGSAAAVAGKARVVAAFPPSAALFATLGLPVNLVGLSLAVLRSQVESGDGPSTLMLEGRIANLRAGSTPVPALRIAVRDKDGRELYHWTASPPKGQLAPGETAEFRSRLKAPPHDGQTLAVSFAEPRAEAQGMVVATQGDR